jgi:hypothetical protein
MTISTQTIGVVVMAVMAVSGIAMIQDILEHRSVQERMLYYQAEELAMDIEIMEDWGDDSIVIKDFRRSYTMDIDDSTSGEPGNYMLALTTDKTTKRTPIQSDVNIQDDITDEARTFCLSKPNDNTVRIYEGSRARTASGGGVC